MGDKAQEYRDKYFEEKFNGLYAKLDILIGNRNSDMIKQTEIEERVICVERKQLQCPVNTFMTSFSDYQKETNKRLDELELVTDDINYYKRNPWQLKLLIIGGIVVLIITAIPSIISIIEIIKNSKP